MHSPLSFCKNASPTFSVVHLLHRLYGVDAPGSSHLLQTAGACCAGVIGTGLTHYRPHSMLYRVAVACCLAKGVGKSPSSRLLITVVHKKFCDVNNS